MQRKEKHQTNVHTKPPGSVYGQSGGIPTWTPNPGYAVYVPLQSGKGEEAPKIYYKSLFWSCRISSGYLPIELLQTHKLPACRFLPSCLMDG